LLGRLAGGCDPGEHLQPTFISDWSAAPSLGKLKPIEKDHWTAAPKPVSPFAERKTAIPPTNFGTAPELDLCGCPCESSTVFFCLEME
jgi:hypothetical protein